MVLKLRYLPPNDWRKAKCFGMPVDQSYDPFFRPAGDVEWDQQDAIDFCNGTVDGRLCPVRTDCLLFALTNNCREGVWGGMSELARAALRKRWQLRSGKEPCPEWRWMNEEDAIALIEPGQRESLLADDEEDE